MTGTTAPTKGRDETVTDDDDDNFDNVLDATADGLSSLLELLSSAVRSADEPRSCADEVLLRVNHYALTSGLEDLKLAVCSLRCRRGEEPEMDEDQLPNHGRPLLTTPLADDILF
jgi:hypothetical protein